MSICAKVSSAAYCKVVFGNFCTLNEYFTISHCVFNFSFLSLVLYGILGGPKFILGGPALPEGPLAKKNCYMHKYLRISV